MDSALRPRDIQARIRAGESAEDVAAAAGTPVEKIMIYAAPVLAEREHMAVRAQASSVRRRIVGDSSVRALGEAVELQMHEAEADHESIEWDAWQREDRRWVLIASYESPARDGLAEFVFDPRGNYVTCTNEDAKWLVGEPLPAPAPVRDDLQQARERRLEGAPAEPSAADGTEGARPESNDEILSSLEPAAPPAAEGDPVFDEDDTIDLGETAARIRDMVAGSAAPQPTQTAQPTQPTRSVPERPAGTPSAEPAPPAAAPAARAQEPAEQPAAPRTEPAARAEASEKPSEQPSEQLTLDETPEPPVRKKKNRRSVPSWDEIMFGGGPAKD